MAAKSREPYGAVVLAADQRLAMTAARALINAALLVMRAPHGMFGLSEELLVQALDLLAPPPVNPKSVSHPKARIEPL